MLNHNTSRSDSEHTTRNTTMYTFLMDSFRNNIRALRASNIMVKLLLYDAFVRSERKKQRRGRTPRAH